MCAGGKMPHGTQDGERGRLVPPGSCERFLDTGAGRVRVLRSAHRPPSAMPLLLIHGGGTDNAAISWFELFESIGPQRDVVAVDLPGFGYTEVPPVGGPDRQADFVVEVMAMLGLGRAIVAGVSMGGDIAMNVALRHPDRVEALVLIAPGGLIERFRNRVIHTAAWLAAKLPDRVMDPVARLANRHVEVVLRSVVDDIATLPAPVVGEFVREARRLGTSPGYRRYNQAVLGRTRMYNNLLPVVATITAPTLLFHGDNDRLVSPDGSRRAAALIPRAQLVIVPRVGHWAHLEASDRFRHELENFLRAQGIV